MALDFHNLENSEYLFSLYDKQIDYLSEVFESFTHQTGISIDLYKDNRLTVENQMQLIRIIDKYIDTADLNKNKQKTSVILEFKGLLSFFMKGRVELKIYGN